MFSLLITVVVGSCFKAFSLILTGDVGIQMIAGYTSLSKIERTTLNRKKFGRESDVLFISVGGLVLTLGIIDRVVPVISAYINIVFAVLVIIFVIRITIIQRANNSFVWK